MADPRYGFAGDLSEALKEVEAQDQTHEHCWHDEDSIKVWATAVGYKKCCRCDEPPPLDDDGKKR